MLESASAAAAAGLASAPSRRRRLSPGAPGAGARLGLAVVRRLMTAEAVSAEIGLSVSFTEVSTVCWCCQCVRGTMCLELIHAEHLQPTLNSG